MRITDLVIIWWILASLCFENYSSLIPCSLITQFHYIIVDILSVLNFDDKVMIFIIPLKLKPYKKIMVTSSESRILTYYKDISCNLYWQLQHLQSYHVVKQWSALQHPISIATLLLVVVLDLSIELSVWLFNNQTNIFFRIYHKLTSCFPIPVF